MNFSFILFKKTALSIALGILFPFLVYKGFNLAYPYPSQSSLHAEKNAEKKEAMQKEWQENIKHYYRYYFYVALLFGTAAIILGFVVKLGFLGAGLIIGGIATLLSSLMYWHYLNQISQFIALLIAFIALILGGYFLLERSKKTT